MTKLPDEIKAALKVRNTWRFAIHPGLRRLEKRLLSFGEQACDFQYEEIDTVAP